MYRKTMMIQKNHDDNDNRLLIRKLKKMEDNFNAERKTVPRIANKNLSKMKA